VTVSGKARLRLLTALVALNILAAPPRVTSGTRPNWLAPNVPAHLSRLADWPQFHFDAGHTGNNPKETILSRSNVAGLVLDWKGESSDYNSYFSPVVSDGVVYMTTYGPSHLLAFPERCPTTSGCRPLWVKALPDGADTTPTVADGNVYLGTNTYDLEAFDAADGHFVWKAHIGKQMVGPPVVAGRIVFMAPIDGTVYAFDALTGALRWTTFTGPRGYQEDNTLSISEGTIYVSSDGVYALDAATGKFIWKNPAVVGGTPSVVGDTVYVGADRLYALDALSGATLWSAPAGYEVLSTPAVAYGAVYVNGSDGKIHAFQATDGKPLWTAKIGLGLISTSPAVANGVVYTYSDTAVISAFAADCKDEDSDCAPLWSSAVGFFVPYSSPAVVNGSVYVVNGSGFSCCATVYSFGLP
jgi:outer membrane protein assembly factor BamB